LLLPISPCPSGSLSTSQAFFRQVRLLPFPLSLGTSCFVPFYPLSCPCWLAFARAIFGFPRFYQLSSHPIDISRTHRSKRRPDK
jgi:hypothetical protein